MPYIECPECGQRALSVATRCPRCGHNYPQQPIWQQAPGPGLSGLRPLLPMAGVLVAAVIIVVLIGRLVGARTATTPSSRSHAAVTGRPVPPPSTPEPVATAGGSAPRAAPAAAPSSTVVPTAASAPAPAPAPASPGIRRYARTWVNIRGARALVAPSVRVLKPGEAVMVDSLRRGWYRVLAEGRPVGYVYRSNLDATPPSAQP